MVQRRVLVEESEGLWRSWPKWKKYKKSDVD